MLDSRSPRARIPDTRATAGRAWYASVIGELRAGHLQLADLPRAHLVLVLGSLALIFWACVILVGVGLGIDSFGPSIAVPGILLAEEEPVDVPALVAILAGLALALVAAGLASSALGTRPLLARLGLSGTGIVALSYTATVALAMSSLDVMVSFGIITEPALLIPPKASLVVGAIASFVVIFSPLRFAYRHRTAIAVLAGLPFILPTLATIPVAAMSFPVTPVAQAMFPSFPASLSAGAWIAGPLKSFAIVVGLLLVPLGFWQAITWARASSRQVGERFGVTTERYTVLLVIVASAKLTWIALGLAGALPIVLGGRSAVWSSIQSDNAFALTYAVVLVALVVWALSALRTRAVSDRRLERGAIATLLAFWLPSAVAIAGLIALPLVLFAVGQGPASDAISALSESVTDGTTAFQVVVIVATLIVGLTWLVRRRQTSLAIFLLAFGLWTLPQALRALVFPGTIQLSALGATVAVDPPSLATMDLLITVVVLVLALYAGMRRERYMWLPLGIGLVVSTLLVHTGTALPSSDVPVLLSIALVFPIAYELLFDSEEINGRGSTARGTHVIRSLALRLAALAILAFGAASLPSILTRSEGSEFAKLVFAAPMALIIVAISVQRRYALRDAVFRRPHEGTEVEQPQRLNALGASVGVAVGVAVLVAVVSLGLRVTDGLAAPLYPTDAERLAELDSLANQSSEQLNAVSVEDPDPGGDIVAIAAEGRAWMERHTPAVCFLNAWDAYDTHLVNIRALGLVVSAVEPGTSDEDLALLDTLNQQRFEALSASATELETAMAAADC